MLQAHTQKSCIFVTIVLHYLITREPGEGAKCIWGRTEDLEVVQQKNTYMFNHSSAMVNFSCPNQQSERRK